MHWINSYMTCPYVDGGRDLNGLDCWGLVRDVLHKQFAVPPIASFGTVSPDDKTAMTQGFAHVVKTFNPSPPLAGCVAAGFFGGNLIHVGICVDCSGFKVLHTSRKHGPSLDTLAYFQRLFPKVIYYRYDSKSINISQ
ncbi:C40 family peptidase [Shewanella surugensis]|uniref:C40 family peptidase n=1 Tax=Shewanella surugensis TaxID=212020 RepID=A0ABT0L7D9_9GAMM|nr:C40 family peptidase [Shewanella surugensis]MCL1123608.1 C40 family peptidase [Shewanella surugensis]